MQNIFKTALFLFSSSVLFAFEKEVLLEEVLPSLNLEERERLITEKKILLFHEDGFVPKLLPNTELSRDISQEIEKGALGIGIEALYFFSKNQFSPSYEKITKSERMLSMYNILRSVSTLTGLEYYSTSRKKMRTLFMESWIIKSPDKKKIRIPDSILSTIPKEETLFIHQRDKTFGASLSKMVFRGKANSVSTSIKNITPLRYMGLIRVIDSQNQQTHLIVMPVREGVLVYGVLAAKTLKVNMFLRRAENSLTTRMIALAGWYGDGLDKMF